MPDLELVIGELSSWNAEIRVMQIARPDRSFRGVDLGKFFSFLTAGAALSADDIVEWIAEADK